MSFQSAPLPYQQGAGIVGEWADNSPQRALTYILQSDLDATTNTFGFAFTVKSQGIAQAGNPAGTAVYAGILADPKSHALLGTTSDVLAPSLDLPNNTTGALATMGRMYVLLPAVAAIGDYVIFDNVTGALETIAPGADLPADKSFAYAVVDELTVAGAGLAIIKLTDAVAPPVPAGP